MEREVSDLLIIAHETILRVLCAYFLEKHADVSPMCCVIDSRKSLLCRFLGMRLLRLFLGLIRVKLIGYELKMLRCEYMSEWKGILDIYSSVFNYK